MHSNEIKTIAIANFWVTLDRPGSLRRVVAGSEITVSVVDWPHLQVTEVVDQYTFSGFWSPSLAELINCLGAVVAARLAPEIEKTSADASIKTLFMFDDGAADIFFFELEGDHTRFNDVYIGEAWDDVTVAKVQSELNDLVYDGEGKKVVTVLTEPTRDWTHFVRCGIV